MQTADNEQNCFIEAEDEGEGERKKRCDKFGSKTMKRSTRPAFRSGEKKKKRIQNVTKSHIIHSISLCSMLCAVFFSFHIIHSYERAGVWAMAAIRLIHSLYELTAPATSTFTYFSLSIASTDAAFLHTHSLSRHSHSHIYFLSASP